jgi:hypothetical protein
MVEEAIHHVTTRKQSREREEAREPISVSRAQLPYDQISH